jgi:2'-5' RNA ligase
VSGTASVEARDPIRLFCALRLPDGARETLVEWQAAVLGGAEGCRLPHVTVLRFRERPHIEPPLPAADPFVTSEAAVYMSVLRPSGAQYVVLESVAIGR